MENILGGQDTSGDANHPNLDAKGDVKGDEANVDPFDDTINALFDDGSEDASGGPSPGKGKETPFGNMSSEEAAKHFQSMNDKTLKQWQDAQPAIERGKNLEDFLNQVYEDETVKQAFIADLAPELVKQKDPYASLQEKLSGEFGEDFTPDDDEAKTPLSKSWRYYKRVDEVYKDMQDANKGGVPKTIKELREERASQRRDADILATRDKKETMDKLKWDDNTWANFAQWAGKLKTMHLGQFYNATMKRTKPAPSLVNQLGGDPVTDNQHMQNLNKFFG